MNHPRAVTGAMVTATRAAGVGRGPAVRLGPAAFPFLSPVKVDTDPENMLRRDEPIRVFHDRMKREFSLYDMVVAGRGQREGSRRGLQPREPVANPRTGPVRQDAALARSGEPGRGRFGVIEVDLISPSTVDNIEQAGLGAIRFEWLMSAAPTTRDQGAGPCATRRRVSLS